MASRNVVEKALRLLAAGCNDPAGHRIPFSDRVAAYLVALEPYDDEAIKSATRAFLRSTRAFPSAAEFVEYCERARYLQTVAQRFLPQADRQPKRLARPVDDETRRKVGEKLRQLAESLRARNDEA